MTTYREYAADEVEAALWIDATDPHEQRIIERELPKRRAMVPLRVCVSVIAWGALGWVLLGVFVFWRAI